MWAIAIYSNGTSGGDWSTCHCSATGATGRVYVMIDASIDQMSAAVLSTIKAELADKSGLPSSAFRLSILAGSVIFQLEITATGVDGKEMAQALVSAWESGPVPKCAGFTVEYVGFDMPSFAPTAPSTVSTSKSPAQWQVLHIVTRTQASMHTHVRTHSCRTRKHVAGHDR